MLDGKLLNKTVEKYRPAMVKFARDIIAIRSFSGEEGPLARRIRSEMKKVGFDAAKFDKMGNVIGRIGKGKTRIMVDAHIDTVGIGDPSAWKWDPFKGKYENGVIYG